MIDAANLVKHDVSLDTVIDMSIALRNLSGIDDLEARFSAYRKLHVQLPADWKQQRIADDVAVSIERRRRAAGHQ